MLRYIPKLLTILLLCFPVAGLAVDWKAYSSDNFTIYSDARSGKVETVLADFEEFRAVARSFLRLQDKLEHGHVRIYMFSSNREYRRFVDASSNLAGFFIDALGGPRLVIGPEQQGMGFREILFHEYVHNLMSQNVGFNYPRWYSEGMAEVLSSYYGKFDYVAIGEVPSSRISTLQGLARMNVEDLVRLESAENARDTLRSL